MDHSSAALNRTPEQINLLKHYPFPACIIDKDTYDVQLVNSEGISFYGYSEEEFASMDFLSLFVLESKLNFILHFSRDKHSGLIGQYHHVKKNGEVFNTSVYLVQHEAWDASSLQLIMVPLIAANESSDDRQRYKAYIEQSSEAIWRMELKIPLSVHVPAYEMIDYLSRHAFLAECNDTMARMYGYHLPAEMIGMKADLFFDLAEPQNREHIEKFIANGFRLANAESRQKDRFGNYKIIHNSFAGVVENSMLVRIWGTQRDVTLQLERERQLHYQATVLENISEIVITTDLEFRIQTWNKSAEECYGIKEMDALGKISGDILQLQYKTDTREEAIRQLLQNGIWEGELSFINAQGEERFFVNVVKYITDKENNRIGFLSVGRDVTDKKLAERDLEVSEQFYRTLISNSLDGILLTEPDGTITFASPTVTGILGYETEELIGRNSFDFVHPQDFLYAVESYQNEIIEKPITNSIVVRLLKKSGEWLWCMVRGHNLLENKNVNKVVIYLHDDTLRKQANDALKQSEKKFRDLIRDLQIGVILQDKEGKTMLYNKALANMLQIDEQELIGRNINEFTPDVITENGKVMDWLDRPTIRSIRTGQPSRDVVMGVFRPKSGDRVWLLINMDPISDENGELLHIISSVKDITHRKRMEEEMLAKKLNHQKQLTQATIDGQEKERLEIGKELHDNIGQQLTTIKLYLDMARSDEDHANSEMLNMAAKNVSQLINEVRGMSRSLVPFTLKDLGLIDSITELVESIARTRLLQIEFEGSGFDERQMPENVKLTIFRIVQEQLNNIVKHAAAKKIFLALATSSDQFKMLIKDDGVGFDRNTHKKGLGFTNISNRVALLGGKLEVNASPGQGCSVYIEVPLQQVALTLYS